MGENGQVNGFFYGLGLRAGIRTTDVVLFITVQRIPTYDKIFAHVPTC